MNFWKSKRFKETVIGYSFLLPNILGFLVFTATPVLLSFLMCFFEKASGRWIYLGLYNFKNLIGFHLEAVAPFERTLWYHVQHFFFRWLPEGSQYLPLDPELWQYFGNTLFLMLALPFSIIGSLFVAMIMNQKLKGRLFFRTAFFLPNLSSVVAMAFLWLAIYDTQYGLANIILRGVAHSLAVIFPACAKFQGVPWLSSMLWAKPAFVLMNIWGGIGGMNMMLYLAALQNIPPTLYEAADIDGANWWQRFLRITWPMVSPTTFFMFVMGFIRGLQSGVLQGLLLTDGGPAGSTTTLGLYVVRNFYDWGRPGYASGVAWILFLMIFIVTIFNWKYAGSKVHYE